MARSARRIRSIHNGIARAMGVMVSCLSSNKSKRLSQSKPLFTASFSTNRPILVVKKKINLGDEVTRQSVEAAVAKFRPQLKSETSLGNFQSSTFRSHDKKVATRCHCDDYTSIDFRRIDYKRQRRRPKGSPRITSVGLRQELMP